jgi:hypothetical protein
MKIKKSATVMLFAVFVFATVHGQSSTVNKVNKAANDVNYTSNAVNNTANATTNSANSIANAKKSLATVFKGNKKDANQNVVVVAGIEFDDENLSLLKEEIGKVKGVKSPTMEYKSGTAMIQFSFKGKPSEVWEEVPKSTRQLFKLTEAGDNNIIVEYKNPKSPSESAPENKKAATE